jgi:diguanylate cyclase
MAFDTASDLARTALRRLAELRLPPTPENFSRLYGEAAASRPASAAHAAPAQAAPAPKASASLDEATVLRFDDLVGRAVTATTQLTCGLDRHDRELDALVAGQSDTNAVELLRAVLSMTQEMHSTVKASQTELIETRQSLVEIKAQLKESQKLLGEDPLTGTGNRRALSTVLSAEIARARRNDEPLSLVMLDVDHFKAINDTYGHAVGDAALVHLASLARAMLRGNDAFIRYGGEEFLMVLPETALKGGVSTGQRLQNLLRRQPLVHRDKVIPMTFSGGVSELAAADTEESLVQRADAALYQAKRAGRNLVMADKPA